ncbi:MAG: Rpn family recombination-promoting nuclease/putative transposase [Proteobacteria bacterium]|nr:Rpn family recombination-promoting nuclease/putative transposase [Pseudomonadota bacterium]
MTLLDPKNDAVFKLMLVDDDAVDARISLLTAVLKPDSPITSATVKNPHMPKTHIKDKDTILDILIELGDGQRIDLEMQMAWKAYIPERAYFYAGKLITSQLSRGQKYQTLKRVSTIFLLNAVGFPDAPPDHAHYVFRMTEQLNLAHIPPYITMHFVEIPKLIRHLPPALLSSEDLALANWCRFLYNPNQPGLDEVLANMPALKNAKKKLEEISANAEKREIARMRERGRRDYESDLEDALCRGRAEGLLVGLT